MTDDKPKYGENPTPEQREWNARQSNIPHYDDVPATLEHRAASAPNAVAGAVVAVVVVLVLLIPLGIFLTRWALGVL